MSYERSPTVSFEGAATSSIQADAWYHSPLMAERHIIGLGGGGDTPEQSRRLYDYVLDVVGKERPRLMWVPTASREDPEGFTYFHDRFGDRARLSNLRTYPWPPADLRELILSQDSICVSGGNTANMLAIW